MTEHTSGLKAQSKSGVASAEDGLVILNGPDGVVVTMTAEAAQGTGQSLIAAAAAAQTQKPSTPEA